MLNIIEEVFAATAGADCSHCSPGAGVTNFTQLLVVQQFLLFQWP